jgi:hypothetical protein
MDVGFNTFTSFKPKYVLQYSNTKKHRPFYVHLHLEGSFHFFNAIHPHVLLDTKK